MLRIQNICKSYGTKVAVNGLSFDVRPGEVFGLLGPNGAGKTTTVNLCVGLLCPDAGTVELVHNGSSGRSPADPAGRRMIGVAPQALALYDELSGEENVRFFGTLQGLQGAALKERVKEALNFVGLLERGCDRAGTYSGGMKRRLNLAIALVHDPQLLLLDEPTVGVDPQSRNAIFDNILELKRRGRTIVYTTHYMEEAERLCDRVGIIDHGQLLALDTVDGLIQQHGGKSVVIVEHGGRNERIETEDPFATLVKLRESGYLSRFRVERPDLEVVFLTLTGRHLRD